MEPVRIAIVGCGVMGRKHALACSNLDHTELAAVCDVRQDAARDLAHEYGGATKVFTDTDRLFADDTIDAVVLAMPANIRAELAPKAFAAGKHVLLEKPVGRSADEVQALIDARGDLVGGVCSARYRYSEPSDVATKAVADGRLGNLRVVHCRALRPDRGRPSKTPPPWRISHRLNGGGIFVNWGCYDLDYLLGIIGWNVRPRLVMAQAWPVAEHLSDRAAPGSDAETHIVAMIQCDDGLVINYERGEMTSCNGQCAWQIIGDRGSLRLDMTGREDGGKVILDQTHPDKALETETIWEGDYNLDFVTLGPVGDFAEAIQTGGRPKTGLEESLILQKITDAAYRSADEGRAIEID